MNKQPKVLVLSGYGINCETETAFAFERFGAQAERVHINDLIDGTKSLDNYQILAVPGGFSYGDHTGSGKAMANRIMNNIGEKILAFAQRDTLTIGICNGFQILVALGLVPAITGEYGIRQAALMRNKSTRYQCEWVRVTQTSQKCIWTQNIGEMDIPIAHGEGNFYIDEPGLATLNANDQIALRYVGYNPNGATDNIAGVCDKSGRIFGLMPHPERFLFMTNHPNWTKEKERLRREGTIFDLAGTGEKIFANAVKYFA
jgi:phosphoribosylformylglycinamidine synthase I